MIKINCTTNDTCLLSQLEPLQGNLKRKKPELLNELKESLLREGLLMPFVIWDNNGVMKLLDGHTRREVLMSMAADDHALWEQRFPCIYVQCETEDDAKKALLQITSSYGNITKKGAVAFLGSIQGYSAPSVRKFTEPRKERQQVKDTRSKVIRIAVKEEQYEAVLNLFKQINYITVLR